MAHRHGRDRSKLLTPPNRKSVAVPYGRICCAYCNGSLAPNDRVGRDDKKYWRVLDATAPGGVVNDAPYYFCGAACWYRFNAMRVAHASGALKYTLVDIPHMVAHIEDEEERNQKAQRLRQYLHDISALYYTPENFRTPQFMAFMEERERLAAESKVSV